MEAQNVGVSKLLGVSWPLNRNSITNGKVAELSDGKTYYEVSGPANGQPLVLIHGLGLWSFSWDDLVDHLVSLGFRVLTFDNYGRGHSSPAKADCVHNVELYVKQLKELLDLVFPAQKVNLAGFSMGGAIVATFASLYPDRLNKLALFAPAGAGANVPWTAYLLKLPILGWAIFNAIGKSALLKHQDESQMRDEFHKIDTVSMELRKEWMQRLRWQVESKEGFLESFHSTIVNFDMQSLYIRWSSIPKTLPVLLLWGDKDALAPYENNSKAKLVTLNETGHTFFVEEKQRSFEVISGFFE